MLEDLRDQKAPDLKRTSLWALAAQKQLNNRYRISLRCLLSHLIGSRWPLLNAEASWASPHPHHEVGP